MSWLILVDNERDLSNADTPHKVMSTKDYVSRPQLFKDMKPKIINLSRSYAYQGLGYYCSLLAEARGHAATTRRGVDSRTLFGQERYERSLRVLSRMRNGESLTAAARLEGIRPETVRRNVGEAIERGRNSYRVKPDDRLYRRMQFLTERGYVGVEPATAKEAAKLGRYHAALAAYLERGDENSLRRFARMKLRLRDRTSLSFITDLEVIDHLAAAGALSFDHIYRYAA